MFCTKCGKQIPDSTKFCPYCGANCSPEQDIAGQAGQVFNKVEKELGSAFDEVKQSFNGNSNNQNYNQGYNANQNYSNGYNNGTIPPYSGTRLKDDRGLASYIILSIITCGIYAIISFTRWHMMLILHVMEMERIHQDLLHLFCYHS
ncbi:MAG: zinc-ribbon domain-containing protein [Lachnospira eligens]